jgi:hypothetical protein
MYTLTKIIEQIVAKQITVYLEENNLMDPHQSAYKKGHSCETVIVSVLNDVYAASDKSEISISALLDMSAAFDTIDHAMMIEKLKCLGFTDDVLEWFQMYLSGRSHTTIVHT